MSKSEVQPVDRSAFEQAAKQGRRYATISAPGIGPTLIQSLRGGEFAKVKAAMQRAVLASRSGGDASKAARASVAAIAELIIASVLNPDRSPMFTTQDRSFIAGWDSGLLEYLDTHISRHCGLDEDELDEETAAKNSPATPGGSSPTD